MSPEAPRGEPRKDDQPFEIKLDVPFKPYERSRKFYWPKKDENPAIVYERYDHTLLLRRRVSLYGIPGWIDIISDDPESWMESLVKGFSIEKPFGETHFEEIYKGRDDIEYTEKPYILRFGFHLQTPAEYAKLLNSHVDIELGKERYMAAWNLSVPRVQRIAQWLEDGKEIILPEKNLINLKKESERNVEPGEDARNEEFERVTFVWLPDDLKKLRAIKLTFHRFFDEGDEEQPVEPTVPDRERILVRA